MFSKHWTRLQIIYRIPSGRHLHKITFKTETVSALQSSQTRSFSSTNPTRLPRSPDSILYVSGLPPRQKDNIFQEAFSQFQGFRDIRFKNAHRTAAILTFDNHDDAMRALDSIVSKPLRIKGKVALLRASWYTKDPPSRILYVRGLPTLPSLLNDTFGQYEGFRRLVINKPKAGAKRTVEVEFDTLEQAQAALAASDGRPLLPGTLPIKVRLGEQDQLEESSISTEGPHGVENR